MNRHHKSVNDPIELSTHKAASVEVRIERRVQVLREWVSSGVPLGKVIPRSLTAARDWEDADLGVVKISSPNEFTTTHHLHGKQVAIVQALLDKLHSTHKKPKSRSARPQTFEKNVDRKVFDGLLADAVSQWHTERDKHIAEKTRADSAEARSAALLEMLNQKDALISDLRSQIVARRGLKAVE